VSLDQLSSCTRDPRSGGLHEFDFRLRALEPLFGQSRHGHRDSHIDRYVIHRHLDVVPLPILRSLEVIQRPQAFLSRYPIRVEQIDSGLMSFLHTRIVRMHRRRAY
jgi:hypothetical protein